MMHMHNTLKWQNIHTIYTFRYHHMSLMLIHDDYVLHFKMTAYVPCTVRYDKNVQHWSETENLQQYATN